MGAIFGCLDTHDTGRTIRAMSESLIHRGAGDVSEREVEGGAVAVRGPGRLWTDPEGDITIAIAGTITPRDPEEILRCFRESRLDTLRGSFVLAIAEKDRIHLIRDAAGRRTIYHGRTRNGPVFAIEPKAIWSLPSFVKSLRPTAVAEYLTFSFIPGRGTMLENLFEVPAGHVVTLQKDRAPRIHRWFRPEESSPATRSDDEWIDLFQTRFSSTIREMRPLGKPAAVFLSGGIDSSIVAAELASQHDAPVHTFAVHFGKRYPNELPFARTVADHCGTAHEEILVEPRDFLSSLPEIVRALDEPIGDPVAMPNYLLAKAVSECGFDRVFNGEGGDPCFGGPKNLPMLLGHWYGGQDYSAGFRERAYLASYRRAYEEIEPLLTPEMRAQIHLERDLEAHLTPFFEAEIPSRFLDKLLSVNIRLKGAHLILPKVERMLAAHGMSPLSPLFDEDLIRLVFQLPGHLKLHAGIDKVILKRAFRNRLPDSILDRPKSGMRVPVHYWFRRELKRYARELLNQKRIKEGGIFNPDRVAQLLRYDTENARGRYGIRLWMLLTFELWREMVFPNNV